MDFQFSILSILGIVALYIPGYYFRKFYYSGQFTKQLGFGAFTERFIKYIFWGFVIQLLTLFFFTYLGLFELKGVTNVLNSVFTGIDNIALLGKLNENIFLLLAYFISTLFVSFIFGTLSFQFIRIFKLDQRFPVFRYANKWHYIFKGEPLSEQRKYFDTNLKITYVELDVLVNTGEQRAKLYKGELADHTLNSGTMELDSITLYNSQRWSSKTENFRPIPGKFLILPHDKIINYNITFQTQKKYKDGKSPLRKALDYVFNLLITGVLFLMPLYYIDNLEIIKGLLAWVCTVAIVFFVYVLYLIGTKQAKTDETNKTRVIAVSIVMILLMAAGLYLLYNY